MKLRLPETLNGYHIFAAFAAFFGVVFAVNGIMVFMALSSWSGLSTDHPYERGLRYNKTLEAMAQRDALGWQETIVFTQPSAEPLSAVSNGAATNGAATNGAATNGAASDGAASRTSGAEDEGQGRITLEMRDRDGELLEGLLVAGQIWRPTNEGFDRPIELKPVGAGRYEADVAFPLRGNWLVRLNARHDPNRQDIVRHLDSDQAEFVFGVEKRIYVQ